MVINIFSIYFYNILSNYSCNVINILTLFKYLMQRKKNDYIEASSITLKYYFIIGNFNLQILQTYLK